MLIVQGPTHTIHNWDYGYGGTRSGCWYHRGTGPLEIERMKAYVDQVHRNGDASLFASFFQTWSLRSYPLPPFFVECGFEGGGRGRRTCFQAGFWRLLT